MRRFRSRSRRSLTRGFTLVEVVTALAVAVVAMVGLMAATTAGSQLQIQTQEYGRASRAVALVRDDLRAGDLDAKFAAYEAAPTFDVGSVDVEIQFPEQVLVDLLGGPVPVGWRYRDLDQDGDVELDPAATSNTSLVPVEVVVRWSGGETRSTFVVTER